MQQVQQGSPLQMGPPNGPDQGCQGRENHLKLYTATSKNKEANDNPATGCSLAYMMLHIFEGGSYYHTISMGSEILEALGLGSPAVWSSIQKLQEEFELSKQSI